MAAIANLVLANGETTPVNKTFAPQDCTSTLASWTDRSSGISVGMPTVTMAVGLGDSANKVTTKVLLPILETVSGSDGGYTPSPKVAYTCVGKIELVFPIRSTLQNRKDVLAFVKNMMTNAAVQKAVEEFERPY